MSSETPEAEEVEALAWDLATLSVDEAHRTIDMPLSAELLQLARRLIRAGYRKADTARDAELRAEGAAEAILDKSSGVEASYRDGKAEGARAVRERVEAVLRSERFRYSDQFTRPQISSEATATLRAALTEAGDESLVEFLESADWSSVEVPPTSEGGAS